MRRRVGLVCGLLALIGLAIGYGSTRHPGEPWKPRLVIVMAIDTCRADHLGCYGYARATTPNIDRLARQGVLFERAFSQANESLFSYASMLTGLYPERIGRLDYETFHLEPGRQQMASLLKASGVETAAFVAGGHLSKPFGFSSGFDTYEDRWDFGSFHDTFPAAMDWLDRKATSGSYGFLLLQGYDVHAPYQNNLGFGEFFDPGYKGVADRIISIPDASDNIYEGTWFPSLPTGLWFVKNSRGRKVLDPVVFERIRALAATSRSGKPLSPRDVAHLVSHYDGCLAYADVYVGLLLARIQALHLERETLVVVLGDHGEDLMEHGFFNHRDCVNDSSVHVPLLMWGPGGLPAGRRVKDVVQLVDLLPTLLDTWRLPIPPALDGRSLRDVLAEGASTGPMPVSSTSWTSSTPPTSGTSPTWEGRAFSEGILPMTTVRSADARLVFLGSSRVPLPPLDTKHFRFYTIDADGREQVASTDHPQARALREDLRKWRERLRQDEE